MKKLVRPLVALVVVMLGVVIVPPAQAKAPPPSSYSPQTGALFNNPDGTSAEQLALLNHITNAIDSVPENSIIRIAAYSFSYQPMANALIAAHERGVQVRLLIDSHTDTSQLKALRSALGTDRSKRSYLRTCTYGCMSSKASYMHSKLYLFSRAGSSTRVSMISSTNPAWTGASESWNNLYTIAGDKTIYDANVDNFNDMLPDKTNTDYYHTVSSGPYKQYFFPRAGSTPTSDTLYNVLSDVTCTGAASGYGAGGKTVIKVAAYQWTSLRIHIAKKLTELKGKGCNIEVIYPSDNVDTEVATELLKKSIPVYNGRLDRDDDGVNDLYPHSKYLLINGVYQGNAKVKAVYTASQNFTNTSLRESNEVMLRIPINSVHDQYVSNFNLIKNNYTVKVTSASKTTAGVDSARKRVLRDNAPDPDE